MSALEESNGDWRVQCIGMGREHVSLPDVVAYPVTSLKINPEQRDYEMEVSSVLLCFCIVSA